MIKLTPQELAAMSSDIIVGSVTDTRSEWTPDRSRIRTLVTVQRQESVKGTARGEALVIEVPGGTVGTVGEAVEDSPRFSTGERVLVFLKAQGDTFSVVGGFQGKRLIDSRGNIAGTNTSLAEFIRQVKGEAAEKTSDRR